MPESANNVVSLVESILFMHGEPISRSRLAKLSGVSETKISEVLETLSARYAEQESGLSLITKGKDVEIVTKPENAPVIEGMIKADREESLGKATIEVLSIVAYRAPVTRAKIDAIRGVNCSFALRNLLLRGLVEREPNPLDNREYRYLPSFRLLELLGISSIEELPDFKELSADTRIEKLSEIPDESRGEEVLGKTNETEAL